MGIVPKNFPLHVDLELSSACDSRCEFCPITPNNELKPKDSIFPTGFMSEKLFKKVVDECEGKASSIKLNWRGEATLHPKFNEFIDYIMQKDFIEVMINTHGNYPPKKRDAVHKLDKIIFSIDSLSKEKYESIRRRLSFEKLQENFSLALNHRLTYGKPQIKVNCTVQKKNEDEIESFKKAFPPSIVDVRFAPVFERTTTGSEYKLANMKVLARKNCGYPFQRVMVSWHGKTTACCVPWNLEKSDLVTGDANKQSIESIWDGAKHKAIQKDASSANYTFNTCKNCMSWASYKVVDQEKLKGIY